MRFDYFSIIGYVSALLWLVVPVLWMLHAKLRPRRWLCHFALVLALLAYLLAKINSVTYVEQIEPDQSAAIAAAEAERQAAAKAAEAARSGDAAKVGFAEDSHSDKLDKGGMDEADLKYMDKMTGGGAEPAWKQKKKKRSGDKTDDSVDGMLGDDDGKGQGMAEASEAEKEKEPVVMPERDVNIANRLDMLNLMTVRLFVLGALLLVVVDYFRRFNVYSEAYLPLPLPSEWMTAISPLPPVQVRPVPSRRSIKEELEWVTRRGDCFVYMAREVASADAVPSSLPRFVRKSFPVEVIRVRGNSAEIADEFVFEAVWYGRASFVVDSPDRALQMLGGFMKLLSDRKPFNARAANSVHIVWDCGMPLDAVWQTEFAKLAKATGMSLVVCSDVQSK